MSLRDTSIATKLSAGFGLALALTFAVGLLAVFQLSTFSRFATSLTESWLPEIEMLGEMKREMSEHRMLAERRTETRSFRQLADIAVRMQGAETTVELAEKTFFEKTDTIHKRQLLRESIEHWEAYVQSFEAVIEKLDGGNLEEGLADFQTGTLTLYDSAYSTLEDLLRIVRGEGIAAVEIAQVTFMRFLILTIAILLASALGVGSAIVWVTRSISTPIRLVSTAMNKLTDGDDSVVIPARGDRNDEIGDLLAAAIGYRDTLIRSRHLAKEATTERERLLAATRNMPVGLSMFDQEKRLIICNDRYAEMYKLPPELSAPGTPLTALLEERIRAGTYPGDDPQRFFSDILERADRREPYIDLLELRDGRILSVTYQPMASGGWVSIHEDVTARRKVEARVAYMARHDNLTDLPNRVLFRERLEAALATTAGGASVAVLYLDLDHFKAVNDTLGHPVGDALLKTVAARLKGAIRQDDTVARLGGDEFAIVQIGEDQPIGSTTLAQRLIEALGRPYELDGHHVGSGASVGISVAPDDGIDPDRLLKNADMALYRAKHDGRGAYRFFEQDMDTRMQARRRLELDLQRAMAMNEFEVYYQPLVDLGTNEISGFEALVRWNHPERGLVSPAEFIPLAEEIGLIVPLGEWVLRQACLEAASWPLPVKVAVNLSAVQFKGQKLLSTVVSALAESKLVASRLELEITESVLLRKTEATLATLHQLRALGVRISMDDFGTGYSSLSYLRSFPFDKIKIDRSFIQDSEHDSSIAIIRAVTGLSSSLGMSTTAEGVETKEQLERMRKEGCTEIQGFLISPPRPASQVAELLKADQPGVRAA